MISLDIQLLDTGSNFILVSDDTETEFEYGSFALSLVNSDYDDMSQFMANFIRNNHVLKVAEDLQKNSEATIKLEIANLILKPLYKLLSEYLSKEYLSNKQSSIITLLLMADIRKRITATKIDLTDSDSYIPFIYSAKELHNHVRNILLKNDLAFVSPLQEQINQIQFHSSVITTKSGAVFQCYELEDSLTFLLLDLYKYSTAPKSVNECQCCHKLFYPKYRKSEKYCEFVHVHEYLNCKEVMHRKTPNDFAKARNSFRGYQSGRINNTSTLSQYSEEFLKPLYHKWSAQCRDKFGEYKAKDDLAGFKTWFETTKFTKDRLKAEWNIYQNNERQPPCE